jgi:hypothetical protein
MWLSPLDPPEHPDPLLPWITFPWRLILLSLCYGTVGVMGNSNSIENSIDVRPSYVA